MRRVVFAIVGSLGLAAGLGVWLYDPWPTTDLRPEHIEHSGYRLLSLGDRPLAVIAWSQGPANDLTVHVRRTTWALPGVGRTVSAVGVDSRGFVRAFEEVRDDTTRRWEGQNVDLYWLPLVPDGPQRVFDPDTLGPLDVEVQTEGTQRVWVAGEAHGRLGETTTWGPLVETPVESPPKLEAVDLGKVWSVPQAPWAGARHSHHVEWRFDGLPVVVDVPIAEELPKAWRARVREITRTVSGDCQARSAAFAAAVPEWHPVVIVGLVYLDGDRPPGLYGHAWVEVDSPLGRTYVDPTLGDGPADAARLPLGPDGPDAPWRVLHALSGATIDRIEAR